MFKRLFCAVLATLCLVLALPFSVLAKGESAPELKSASAIVYSLNSGDVLFEKNAEESRAPASLTKITTTMTVLSMCDDPDNTRITVPDAGLFDEITAVGGSNIELQVGETLTVTELLYAVMLPSACDACNVLAYHFGNGSISAFVSEMNRWALEAGATQTNFQNAHGLDAPGHRSTAADTAKIILKALENERFVEIVS
ncbi:MAG: D-alanyl-D-alanine carboxypeptidase, partial [Clostridia bacterium]|nr:D-alanyl-D-alanine carboxypeptidase [Clostridia bacterium]